MKIHYENNKERLQKKFRQKYRILFKEEKTENEYMVENNAKISQKMKNKDKLSIEKYIMKCEIIKNYYKQRFMFSTVQNKFNIKNLKILVQVK